MRWLCVTVLVAACGGNAEPPQQPCTETTYYADRDGDGFGDARSRMAACGQPAGFVANLDDCNDDCADCTPVGVEQCDGVLDENCDGSRDEGCACVDGLEQPCPGGSDVGSCRAGTQTCASGVWQACVGRVEPTVESCNDLDDDCDGEVDGFAQPCIDGSQVGACQAGAQTCASGVWQACAGTAEPTTESCNAVDDDCDGQVDEEPAVDACSGLDNATAACSGGLCTIASCASGFDDCNGSVGDGCEADLGSPATCGDCATACALGFTCENGSCGVGPQPHVEWSTAIAGTTFSGNVHARLRSDGQVMVLGDMLTLPVTIGALSVDTFYGGLFLARLDDTGAPLWLIVDGDGAELYPQGFEVSADGDAYITGDFWGVAANLVGTPLAWEQVEGFGSFAASYADSGTGRWARLTELFSYIVIATQLGPFGFDLKSVAEDPNTLDFSIHRLRRFDSAGNQLFQIDHPFWSVSLLGQEPSGAMIASLGADPDNEIGATCAFVPSLGARPTALVRIETSGACQRLHLSNQFGRYYARRPGGYLFVPEQTPGSIVALDAALQVEWSVTAVSPQAVGTDNQGNIYTLVEGNAGLLSAYGPDGVPRWSIAVSSASLEGVDPATGELLLLGKCKTTTFQVGPSLLPCTGAHIVVKLAGR